MEVRLTRHVFLMVKRSWQSGHVAHIKIPGLAINVHTDMPFEEHDDRRGCHIWVGIGRHGRNLGIGFFVYRRRATDRYWQPLGPGQEHAVSTRIMIHTEVTFHV